MKRCLTFTAYNRPNYLRESLDSWRAVRGMEDQIWRINAHVEPSNIQKDICDMFITSLDFRNMVIYRNLEKNGVLLNPWVALSTAFEDNDFVVLAEDDIVVSDDIFEYFTWASEEFENDPSVATVCAFSRQGGDNSNETFTKVGFGSPLIWGTWKDRWEEHIRDTWDKTYEHRGWDFRLDFISRERNLKTIIPRQSRSDHIGQYNGTHMQPQWFPESRGIGFQLHREPCEYFLGREYD